MNTTFLAAAMATAAILAAPARAGIPAAHVIQPHSASASAADALRAIGGRIETQLSRDLNAGAPGLLIEDAGGAGVDATRDGTRTHAPISSSLSTR